MENVIIETTELKGGFHRAVKLVKMSDGQSFVQKLYPFNADSEKNEDWNTLVYLYSNGYSVPMPVEMTETGITMQYIDNGVLWDIYIDADTAAQKEIILKFVKLLYDLHTLETTDMITFPNSSFLQSELAEIRHIIEEYQLNDYLKILEKLESVSADITAQPLCYIHRDYHPWNVLSDKEGKLYVIDLALKQGDYRFDIAWTYMLMCRTGSISSNEFNEFAEYFLTEYASIKPDVLVDFEFFKQLANLRWLANVKPGNLNEPKLDKPTFFQHLIKAAELSIIDYIGV